MTTLQILGTDPAMRRAWLEHNTGHSLQAAAGAAFEPEEVRGNIENLVGAAQVPLGVAGPIQVNGTHAQGSYYVPFATTEGTLVATYQAGMRAITEAGGANAYVLAESLEHRDEPRRRLERRLMADPVEQNPCARRRSAKSLAPAASMPVYPITGHRRWAASSSSVRCIRAVIDA